MRLYSCRPSGSKRSVAAPLVVCALAGLLGAVQPLAAWARNPRAEKLAGKTEANAADESTADSDNGGEKQTPPSSASKSAAKDGVPRNVQRQILQQIKGKKSENRVESVYELAEYPSVDAAKILVQHGLTSKFEEVRKAAYETLVGMVDNQEVCDFLLQTVRKDTSRTPPRETTCALLAAVLASDLEPVQKETGEILAKAAKQPKGGLLLPISLADELGRMADPISISTLVKLSKQPLFEQEFSVRRSIVLALTQAQEPDAVEALLDILDKATGEVRSDISRYMTAISGEQHEVDAKAWRQWWEAHKEGFEFPPRGVRAVARAAPVRSMSQYYGMPIYAQRLVFVIDASLSMRGDRIEAAKNELINAINELPEGVYFDVIAFHVSVAPWQKKLVIASPENKKLAIMFVRSLDLGRATVSYDALEAALDFDTESIYFLTDGVPRGGKTDNTFQIVDILTRLNRVRRVTINSIGIDAGPEGNPFDDFLKTLAANNYGEYRRVDQVPEVR
ncbi:MAG TPA: hypothetical protein VHC19_18095 [Pirellulales bacterium]|nr:hypothetical protein [Pirellulales bacterium]